MTRLTIAFAVILILLIPAVPARAQQDPLQGRWEGVVQSIQGERAARAIIKKEGDTYTGTITGIRGDIAVKEIKLDGETVTAKSQIDSPQGSVAVNYQLVLKGETLKGKGEVDIGGQTFGFDLDLKRVSLDASIPTQAAPAQPAGQQAAPQRRDVPQPTQKQALEYFLGQWKFKWYGRESPLGPGAPTEGTITYTPLVEGKFAESRSEGPDKTAYRAVLGYNDQKKMLAVFERLANGIEIISMGDWTSPIAIRFDVAPIKVKGQTLRLRRTISIVAAHSYTVTEELSMDGGPFQRLGNGLFTRAGAETATGSK